MDLIQQVAALITVTSAGLYFITVLVKSYKMFKTNEVEIKQEAKEAVQQVVKQAEEIKTQVEHKVEETIEEHKTPQPQNNEPPQAQP
jgi:hypothetical protein